MTAKLRILAVFLCLLLLFTGAAAATDDTVEITPTATLVFETVPDGIINGATITLDAAAEITEETKNLLRQQKPTVTNIAYAVAVTPNGFDKTEVSTITISLPAASEWVEKNPRVAIAAVDGNTVSMLYAEKTGSTQNPVYRATIIGLPDQILLVATDSSSTEAPTETKTPTETQTPTETETTSVATPVPILGILAGFAVVCLGTRRS